MAAPIPNRQMQMEVIDLVSSDDDDSGGEMTPGGVSPRTHHTLIEDSEDELEETYQTPPLGGTPPRPNNPPQDNHRNAAMDDEAPVGGSIVEIDGEPVFIPDENPPLPSRFTPPANASAIASRNEEVASAPNSQEFTVEDCLQCVLEIFPDISHAYVHELYQGFGEESDYEALPGRARLDNIIEQLISSTNYPKQERGKSALKRKREDSPDDNSDKRWERQDRIAVPNFLKGSIQAILKAEFPEIPVHYINETLAANRHLYQTLVALAKVKDESDSSNRPYNRGRPSTKHLADAATIAANCGWPELLEELNAARRRVQSVRAERAAESAKKFAEQENLRKAMEAGETAECSACFDDLPMNRQIHCNGDVAHFTCFDCAQTYIKSEVGDSRCCVSCPAGCGSGFATNQLNLLSDKQLLEKLAQLQQEKDIRDAGLDDLEECPFCDYKAILPPIDEDFEFRCANPECEKVSCRRCKSISHIPLSCEQHAKDNKINSRHKIEEAMTAALIRSCNKCKKQFIKEYGCNKMTCPSCGNLQCYVCSATLKDYNHFDQNPGRTPNASSKLCPLYDNVEERHEREVKEAEAAARAKAVEENPDLSAEDLEIKVSDAIKKSTANRVQRGGGPMAAQFGGAFPYGRDALRAVLGDGDEDDGEGEGGLHDLGALLDGELDFRAPRRRPGGRPPIRLRDPPLGRPANNREPGAGLADAVRHRMEAHRPAQAAPPYGQGFQLPDRVQGFIPVLGFGNNQPQPMQQPHQPGVQANPHVNAQPQNFGGNRQAPMPQFGDFFGDLDFALDGAGAGGFRNALQRPNNEHRAGRGAAPLQPNNIYGQPYLYNGPGAYPAPAPAPAPPQGPPPTQQLPGAMPPPPQPFHAGIRDQRQNFQQLEMLRQQHDEMMRRRERARNLQQQQPQGGQGVDMMQVNQNLRDLW